MDGECRDEQRQEEHTREPHLDICSFGLGSNGCRPSANYPSYRNDYVHHANDYGGAENMLRYNIVSHDQTSVFSDLYQSRTFRRPCAHPTADGFFCRPVAKEERRASLTVGEPQNDVPEPCPSKTLTRPARPWTASTGGSGKNYGSFSNAGREDILPRTSCISCSCAYSTARNSRRSVTRSCTSTRSPGMSCARKIDVSDTRPHCP